MKTSRLIGPLIAAAMLIPGLAPVPVNSAHSNNCDSGWQWGGSHTECRESCTVYNYRDQNNVTGRHHLFVDAEQSYDRGWVAGIFECGGATAECVGLEKCDAISPDPVKRNATNGLCRASASWTWNWGRVRVWCGDVLVIDPWWNTSDTEDAFSLIPGAVVDYDPRGLGCEDLDIQLISPPAKFTLIGLEAMGNVEAQPSADPIVEDLRLSGVIVNQDGCTNITPGFIALWDGTEMNVAVAA